MVSSCDITCRGACQVSCSYGPCKVHCPSNNCDVACDQGAPLRCSDGITYACGVC
jgi:hypothetical protein